MHTKKRTGSTILFLFVLGLISFAFVSVFSYYSSPFAARENGYDAAFFRLVGQGMTKGLLPYRDFFDMKGPVFFFIEYLAQRIQYGRVGIFVMEWINLFLSLAVVCDLFRRCGFRRRAVQLCLLLPIVLVAAFTFEGGNLTEEFSLLPLLTCLDLCIAFFDKCEEPDKLWQQRIYWYAGAWFGFCFGLLAMIRITNAALICAMVLTVVIYLLREKKYRQLWICAGMFLLGLAAAVGPILLYFNRRRILHEMLEAVFVLGFAYSGEKSFLQHMSETIFSETRFLLLLLIVPCVVPVLLRWRGWKERLLVVFGTLFSFFTIASGNNYTHYYTLTIPLLVLAEISLAESIPTAGKMRTAVAALLSAGMLLSQFPVIKDCVLSARSHLLEKELYQTERLVQEVASWIPEESRDSVLCYNLNPAWYTYADLFPCIRYCGWQNHYMELMPEIHDDFAAQFAANPPAWLVLPVGLGELPDFMCRAVDYDYEWICQNESYVLYHYPKTP